MAAANYKSFVDRMIERYEGGYCWDAGDRGGPTRYGITCFDLAQHRHQKMDSMTRWAPLVRAMPLSEAEDIYAQKYAVQCAFNDLNPGCDCVVMDFGVNSGSSRAIKYAQLIVGVARDGVMGPNTLHAINDMSASKFVDDLCNARLNFMRALTTWSRFGAGWSSRVADLRRYSHGVIAAASKPMALMDVEVEETYAEKPQIVHPMAFAKAFHDDETMAA